MGQQQLLLVILVTIIVGIAAVVALNTFSAAADAASRDALQLDLALVASSAQGYYFRPAMLGGGGRTFQDIDFTKFNFSGRVVDGNVLEASNENGVYIISAIQPGEFIVTGSIQDSRNTMVSARVCPNGFRLGTIGYEAAPEPPACM
ncbi:hypothetical protein DYD21_13160 [Rhodohalobacter sp. SW132]|uniref:hypothetical protein n=1 Tax=Rhodohalobacter sp. SW132 TaxID=2293433 RepID=UPI000E2873BA|nr:hypothetical protein [Rhodohalobacter sp. SW132]REL33197.1 hypothetical protein DYD21_13160 [Rhodohalobacter sp. SW132]